MIALVGVGLLVTACGVESSRPAGPGEGVASRFDRGVAFVNCMRTHGEPNMPDPTSQGGRVNIAIISGSGVEPGSPRFTAATNACKHLITPKRGAPKGATITPADKADYRKGVRCMRSRGFPHFPEPVFQNDEVTFTTRSRIDTNSSQYRRALSTCEKLIPAGLPYSRQSTP